MFRKTKSVSKEIRKIMKSKKGFFVDTGILILISVVLGTVLLGGLYAVANDTVFPSVESKIESMFDYSGEIAETRIVGDLNNDGIVDAADVEIMRQEQNSLSGNYDISALDVNGDGQFSSSDLIRIKKLATANEGQ